MGGAASAPNQQPAYKVRTQSTSTSKESERQSDIEFLQAPLHVREDLRPPKDSTGAHRHAWPPSRAQYARHLVICIGLVALGSNSGRAFPATVASMAY